MKNKPRLVEHSFYLCYAYTILLKVLTHYRISLALMLEAATPSGQRMEVDLGTAVLPIMAAIVIHPPTSEHTFSPYGGRFSSLHYSFNQAFELIIATAINLCFIRFNNNETSFKHFKVPSDNFCLFNNLHLVFTSSLKLHYEDGKNARMKLPYQPLGFLVIISVLVSFKQNIEAIIFSNQISRIVFVFFTIKTFL